MSVREPVFAGSFYPISKKEIEEFVKSAVRLASLPNKPIAKAHAYVAPHAGYIYSGSTAAYTHKAMTQNERINEIETIVIVGPNHTGLGRPISVSLEDWKTPVGVSTNDRELSGAIANAADYIEIDEDAHSGEHSIEVQLPFLQLLAPKKRACMICMGDQNLDASKILSAAISDAAKETKRKILVLASSDFNHYESAEVARKKDMPLIDAISKMDSERFNKLIYSLQDTACGFGPITVAMMFAKEMGATSGILLKYSSSGDQTKDYSSVVAYSSIAFA